MNEQFLICKLTSACQPIIVTPTAKFAISNMRKFNCIWVRKLIRTSVHNGQNRLSRALSIFRVFGKVTHAMCPFCSVTADSGKTCIIWKWSSPAERYEQFQTIPTNNAYDWKYFEIDGRPFLAVANFGGSRAKTTTYSHIYRWHGKKRRFIAKQKILTHGARSWEHFEIADDHFIIVANSADPTSMLKLHANLAVDFKNWYQKTRFAVLIGSHVLEYFVLTANQNSKSVYEHQFFKRTGSRIQRYHVLGMRS